MYPFLGKKYNIHLQSYANILKGDPNNHNYYHAWHVNLLHIHVTTLPCSNILQQTLFFAWWQDVFDFPSHPTIWVSRHFSLYIIITLYTDCSSFWVENIYSQPQIPAEEATIECRNVHPGLCPRRIMHLLLFSFLLIFYIRGSSKK